MESDATRIRRLHGGVVRRRVHARDLAPILISLALSIATYVAFAISMSSETFGANVRDAYYDRLVDGLLPGHTCPAKPALPSLLSAADPYAPAVVKEARGLSFSGLRFRASRLMRLPPTSAVLWVE